MKCVASSGERGVATTAGERARDRATLALAMREALEQALATSWDRETLAVYADHLQSIDDPRGELIALDLQIAERGSTPEMASRRTSLLHGWLGALVPIDNVHGSWVGDSMRYGFVEDLEVDDGDPNAHDRLVTILRSAAGPYLRGVTIRGDKQLIERGLEILAGVTHRWLSRLTIRKRHFEDYLDAGVTTAIIAAAPELDLLEVRGYQVFEAFPHPRLRRLRVHGSNAIATLVGAALSGVSGSFAAVTELDFAFETAAAAIYGDDGEPDETVLASPALLPPEQLPALRRLDLSRNELLQGGDNDDDEYGYAYMPELPHASPFAFLHGLAVRRQLTHVRLPSIRSDDDFRELEVALDKMSALVEVEVVRGHYYRIPDLAHPTAKLVRPAPWPWPSPDKLDGGAALSIDMPGTKSGDLVLLRDAVPVLEQRFERLPPAARDAWTRLWQAVGRLDRDGDEPFAVELLIRALEECPIENGGWRQLREELQIRRPFNPGALVRMRYVWV